MPSSSGGHSQPEGHLSGCLRLLLLGKPLRRPGGQALGQPGPPSGGTAGISSLSLQKHSLDLENTVVPSMLLSLSHPLHPVSPEPSSPLPAPTPIHLVPLPRSGGSSGVTPA